MNHAVFDWIALPRWDIAKQMWILEGPTTKEVAAAAEQLHAAQAGWAHESHRTMHEKKVKGAAFYQQMMQHKKDK